jgi:flagellar basal-body rod protein FlgB
MLNRLTDSLNFQAEALRLRSERQSLIASNIANADTPGYVAKDFDFSSALRQATGVGSSGQSALAQPRLAMTGTSAGHVGLDGRPIGGPVQPELGYATNSMTNLDNNTVDMDRERANFADNTVRYEATLRFINGSIRTLNTAITGQ